MGTDSLFNVAVVREKTLNRVVAFFIFFAAGFAHAKLPHFAVKVRAMQSQKSGRLAHVSLDSLNGPADEVLLKPNGCFAETKL